MPGFVDPFGDVPGLAEPGFAEPGFDVPGVEGFVPWFGLFGFAFGLFGFAFGLSGSVVESPLGFVGFVPGVALPFPVGGCAVPPVGG